MKTSGKTVYSATSVDAQFRVSQLLNELNATRADIRLLNEKLIELYSTIRMLFEHHPNDELIQLQVVDTDRFNRVTQKTGFDQLINELEDNIQELKTRESELENQLKSFSFKQAI